VSLRRPQGTKQSKAKKGAKMSWPFGIRNVICPKERLIWAQVRIIHEMNKAILADNGSKTWIPKSRIYEIRLRNNAFGIYVKESVAG